MFLSRPARVRHARPVPRPGRRDRLPPHRNKANLKETPEALYKKAHKSLDSYDFNAAIKTYEHLTASFPSRTRRARRAST